MLEPYSPPLRVSGVLFTHGPREFIGALLYQRGPLGRPKIVVLWPKQPSLSRYFSMPGLRHVLICEMLHLFVVCGHSQLLPGEMELPHPSVRDTSVTIPLIFYKKTR